MPGESGAAAAGTSAAVLGTKWAEVDVAALRHNTALLRSIAGEHCELMAMVKAGGYGHGAVTASRAALAGGATWLGVSSVPEALEIRRAGIDVPVLTVGWATASEVAAAVPARVDLTVYDPAGIDVLVAAARHCGAPARVHWKIDSGMGRLGTRPDGVDEMLRALRAGQRHVNVVGLFTHLANADEDTLDFAAEQLELFLAVAEKVGAYLPGILLHAANSAALLRMPQARLDMVRPGIALYGYPPAAAGVEDLRPALTVHARVTQVKTIRAGESVGYGRAWFAPHATRVASIGAGYADGIDRRNGNNGTVILGGALCPIVGRVSMDQLSVDASQAGPIEAGDVATIIGADGGHRVSAADVAARIGTIPYEVLCAVSSRVVRVPVGAQGILA